MERLQQKPGDEAEHVTGRTIEPSRAQWREISMSVRRSDCKWIAVA
jgi:hypothetical protein